MSVVPQTIDYHHQPLSACVCVCVLIMQLLSATVRPAETPMCSLLIAAHTEVSSPLGVLNRELIDLKDKDHITKREWQLSRTVTRVTNSSWDTGLLMCSHWVGRSWERDRCTKRLHLTEIMISTIFLQNLIKTRFIKQKISAFYSTPLCLLHTLDKNIEKLPPNWRCQEEKLEI